MLKTIAHTCLLTGVLAHVYPSANIVMHKRPNHRCVFLHAHLQVWAIISRKKLSERELAIHCIARRLNPLSAMVAIWHHIIVSYQVFCTERVHWNLDFLGDMHHWEVHWGKECLSIGGCRLNGLRGTSSPFCRHPPIIASQEKLAPKGLKEDWQYEATGVC